MNRPDVAGLIHALRGDEGMLKAWLGVMSEAEIRDAIRGFAAQERARCAQICRAVGLRRQQQEGSYAAGKKAGAFECAKVLSDGAESGQTNRRLVLDAVEHLTDGRTKSDLARVLAGTAPMAPELAMQLVEQAEADKVIEFDPSGQLQIPTD